MRGYRSEIHSLRARIKELQKAKDDLERELGIGVHASRPAGRVGYAAGRSLRRLWRFVSRRGRPDAREIERLRAREQYLLDAIAELQAMVTARAAESADR